MAFRSRMRRREFIAGLGSAAAFSVGALAQQSEQMRRIGVLVNLAADDPGPGRCRPLSQIRGGVGRACTGRPPGQWRSTPGGVARHAQNPSPYPFARVSGHRMRGRTTLRDDLGAPAPTSLIAKLLSCFLRYRPARSVRRRYQRPLLSPVSGAGATRTARPAVHRRGDRATPSTASKR
jgi:hypothetical protein